MKNNRITDIWDKNRNNILFGVLIAAAALLYNYNGILCYRPYSIHQWRQCDCLSITKSYYDEDRKFLEPAIFWLGDGKEGKTVSEFPIIYFAVAKLWKLIGYHEYIFRIINILIVFSGLFCLFKLALRFTSDSFWSLFTVLLLFTSPILVYYTNNFTADAPAFGLALCGLYFYQKGVSDRKNYLYFISFFIFLLGGLIKISSLIAFCALLIIHIYSLLKNKTNNWWYYKWRFLLPYLIVCIVMIAWVSFAVAYNKKYLSGIFLTDIYPIWKLDTDSIKEIWRSLRKELLPAYFSSKPLYLLLLLFFTLLAFYKRTNRNMLLFTSLVFAGAVAYILLFFQAFTVHDYYLTNLLIFIPLPVITALDLIKRNYHKLFRSIIMKSVAAAALLLLMYHTAVINRMKYSMSDPFVKTNHIVGKSTVDLWDWYHWDYNNHMKAYETITPYLREIGITKEDRVLSLPDASINISLYLMDQKGFTNFGYGNLPMNERIELYKRNGVGFLVADTAFINKETELKKYLNEKRGSYMNLDIYTLR